MLLSQALDGFLLQKRIEGLSSRTLESYERRIERLSTFLDNPPVTDISTDDLRLFFDFLRNEYTPQRLTGNTKPLSPRTIRNYWIALRSFYTFATQELDIADAMDRIPAPKVTDPVITPPEPEAVKEMLDLCLRTKDGRSHPNGHRNRAIIATLADTGIRVSSLCAATVDDYDQETGRIDVRNSKGGKSRVVFLGTVARKALWRYLTTREDADRPGAPLFASSDGSHLSRSWVRKIVSAAGERAGVKGIYPHLLRHFFAIQYLRNNGDMFTLQRILGHSSLEMVKRYTAIADVDAERVHRRASPVDNLA
jgi:integrase/recombinase XerD